MNRFTRSALLAILALPLPAQTYIVDANGGPGTHFVDLPAAAIVVPSGSTLLVRPGTYYAFAAVNKSLTVLADPGVIIHMLLPLEIRDLQPHHRVTLRGLQLWPFVAPYAQVDNCRGTVVFDQCSHPYNAGLNLYVSDSDDVRLHDCRLRGGSSPLICTGSTVRASRSQFLTAAYSAIQIQNGEVELADCDVYGGPFGIPIYGLLSKLRLLGSTNVTVGGSYPGQTPAIDGSLDVEMDPSVTLAPIASGPFGSLVTVTTRPMPVVTAYSANAGGFAVASMTGPTNGAGMLVLGLPGLPTTIAPGVESMLLRSSPQFVLAAGALASPLTASYGVPAHPAVRGAAVAWQGASLDPVHGLQLSNGVTYVHP